MQWVADHPSATLPILGSTFLKALAFALLVHLTALIWVQQPVTMVPEIDWKPAMLSQPQTVQIEWMPAPVPAIVMPPQPAKALPLPMANKPVLPKKVVTKPMQKPVPAQPVQLPQKPMASKSGVSEPVTKPIKQSAPEQATIPPRFTADYLQNPPPRYPILSKRMKEQGKVILRVLVDVKGNAQTIDFAKSSGFSRLDRAAEEAVKQWRFVPAWRGDQMVAEWVLVPLHFRLE